MPALPRLRVSALAELAEQLKFVPREAARRHVENAEGLIFDVQASAAYPEDWLVQRITGYRPEIREPAVIVGAALLADLGAMVERLSERAEFETSELAGWPGVGELCQRWGVSRRTLERFRALGLAARRTRNGPEEAAPGKQVLRFSPRVAAWFEEVHAERLRGAEAFSRIDAVTAERMVRRAARYRRRLGCTRAAVAERLAQRFGRSPDAIRRLLKRHDEQQAAAGAAIIFPRPGPATERQSRLIERATRWRGVGIDMALIARRAGKSAASVHRIALEQRAALLRALDLEGPTAPAFAALSGPGGGGRAEGERRFLSSAWVREGLGRPGADSVPEFIAQALAHGWPDPARERAMAIAMAFLRRRAREAIGTLPAHGPGAAEIDAIVTDLRWIVRLKCELVRGEGMLLLKTVEGRLGRPLADLPPRPAARLLMLSLEAVAGPGGAVDRYDPFKGGRLAAPAGLALNRAISRWTTGEGAVWVAGAPHGRESGAPTGRATRIEHDPPALDDWTRAVAPWQMWTEPPAALWSALEHAPEADRLLLQRRYGWLIAPPTSTLALAESLRIRAEQVTRAERRAVRRALAPAVGASAGRPD